MTTGSHQSASGPSASTNRRRISANAPTFGPDRQVAGDRRRRALVRVRRPVVERDGGDLERDAGRQEGEAHRQAGRQRRVPGHDLGQVRRRRRRRRIVPVMPQTNASPNRKIAELNEPSRKYLIAPSVEYASVLWIAGQHVAGQDHQLEAEEQQQQVGRRRDAASRRSSRRRGSPRTRRPAGRAGRGSPGANSDGHRDDRDEQQVEERRQGVDLCRRRRTRRRRRRPPDAPTVSAAVMARPMSAVATATAGLPGRMRSTTRIAAAVRMRRHERADRDDVLPAQWAAPPSGSSGGRARDASRAQTIRATTHDDQSASSPTTTSVGIGDRRRRR